MERGIFGGTLCTGQNYFGWLCKLAAFLVFFGLLAACEEYAGTRKPPSQPLLIEIKPNSKAGRVRFELKHLYVKKDKIYENGGITQPEFRDAWEMASLRWGFRRRNDPAQAYWVQAHKSYTRLEGETFAQTVRDERKAVFSATALPLPLLQEDESNLEVYALFDLNGLEIEGAQPLPEGLRNQIMQLTELSGQIRSSAYIEGAHVYYVHKKSGGIYHGFADDGGNYKVQIPEDGEFFRVVLQEDMQPFIDSWTHKYQSSRRSLIGLDIPIQPLASGQKVEGGQLYDISPGGAGGGLSKYPSGGGPSGARSPLRGYTMDTQNTEALPRAFLLFYQRHAEKVYFLESDNEGAFRLQLPTAPLESGLISYSAERYSYVSSSSFAVLGRGVSAEFALKSVGFVPWSEKIDDSKPFDPEAPKSPLGVPQNLRIGKLGKGDIEVLWNGVENSVGYEISWSTDKNFARMTRTARISHRVQNPQKSSISRLVANTRYFVRLRALAKTGRSAYQNGPYSAPIEAKTDRATLTAPQNITLRVASSSSIELTWNAVPNSSGYKISWSRAPDASSGGSANVSTGQSYTVNGLDAMTKYYFTLVALGLGNYRDSAPSQVRNATTGKTSISSPANLTIVGKSSTSIDLSWRTVNRSRGYEVSWGISPSANDSTAITQNATTHTISGLSATTKYFIKVKALVQSASQATFQDSPYSRVIELTTQTPLAVPGGVTLQNITGQSIKVNWSVVPNASGYEISWGTSNAASGGAGSPATVSAGTSYTISSLNPLTKYYVKVRALGDSSGSAEYEASSYSAAQSATTTKIILGVPRLNPLISSKPDSITIEWPKVANASGYELSWGSSAQASGGTGSPRTITPGSGSTESVTISGLAANRSYYFKARSLGSGNYGNSPWSGAKSQKTMKKPLSVPLNLRVVRTTDASIRLSWNAVPNSSGYRLKLDGVARPKDAPGTSHTITGLQRNTTYTIKVMALGVGDYKSSAFSTAISAKTQKTVLAVPANLRVVGTTSSTLTLIWDAVPNATQYELEQNILSNRWTTGTSYTLSGFPINSNVSIKIRAVGSGNYANSPWSSAVSATTRNYTNVLPTPTNIRSSSSAIYVVIDWDNVPNSGGYIVEYKTNAMPGYKNKDVSISSVYLHIPNELAGSKRNLNIRIYAKKQGEYATSPPATKTYANP